MNTSSLKKFFSSRQAQIGLRFFTYGVMAVSTVLLTAMAIFYAMGYRFNQASLAIEQGGLLQLRSTPEGATVIIDGKEKNDIKTPSRAYLSAGKHTVEMRLNGYVTWKRDFDLQAGQLLWLDYARFMPTDIKTTPAHALTGVADAEYSPDRRWLIMNESASSPVFTIFDLSDETKPTTTVTAIPDNQLTLVDGQQSTYSIIEWDFGSRSVLVRHDIGDVHEVIRIDRSKPNEAVNVSKLFSLKIDTVHFAGGNQSVVYAQNDGVLRRLDIDSSSASAALVTGLKDFSVYGEDRIAFVADRQLMSEGQVSLRRAVGTYENNKEVLVRDYPADSKVLAALTEYYRHQYLAVSSGDNHVEVFRDPTEKGIETPVYTKFDLSKNAEWLNFSSNGRMAVAGSGNTWTTYDLEVAQAYQNTLDGVNVTKPLKWLDDYYLWTTTGDTVRIVEFDGLNRRDITGATDGYPISLSQNGKSMFSFSTSANGAILQESRLVTQQ